MKIKQFAIAILGSLSLFAFINPNEKQVVANAAESDYTYIEGKWQYYTMFDTDVPRDFKRTPYIEGIQSTEPSTYYDSAEGLSGTELKNALKNIIKNPTTSYDWSRYETVDEDPTNTNNAIMVYQRGSYPKSAHVSGAHTWNREHSYPQSKLNNAAAEADSLIIYADDWKTNGARGNSEFGEVTHTNANLVKDSAGDNTANYSSTVFEPTDAAKGEVARSTLYAYVLYDKPIENNFTSLALCLKWHLRFPVTTWEIRRNNLNYQVQKNRNPFIDHPEYACSMLATSSASSDVKNVCANTQPIPMQGQDEEVNNVIKLISAIGVVDYDSEPAIIKAENAYNALSEEQKANVSNYQTLLDARNAFDSLPEIDAEITNVIKLINDIGTVDENSLTKIETAENAYNKLTAEQKQLVSNYQALLDARDTYEEIIASKEVALSVEAMIDALGPITLESESAIIEAENAYAALTDLQKSLVKNYAILVKAREDFDRLANPISLSYTFDFYNESKITSTSGTGITLKYFQQVETNGNGDILTNLTSSGTVQYDKNGGLTLGSGSNTGTIVLTFDNLKFSKIEIYGAKYDDSSLIVTNSTLKSGALAPKGTKLSNIAEPIVYELNQPTDTITISSSSKRATIYQIIFYPEVSPLDELINLMRQVNTCNDYIEVNGLLNKYYALSEEDKLVFESSYDNDGETKLIDKLMYMDYLYNREQNLSNNNSFSYSKLSNNVAPLAIVGLIILATISSLIVLEVKKYKK